MAIQDRRSPTTLALAGTFLLVLVTGILNYTRPYSPTVADAHTTFSFLFVVVLVFHIVNNLRPFNSYLHKIRLTLCVLAGVLLVAVATLMKVPGFHLIADVGYALRSIDRSTDAELTIITQSDAETDAYPLDILAIAGNEYESPPIPLFLGLSFRTTPQTAIWLEDMEGGYIKTLYLTSALSNSSFTNEENFSGGVVRRPEALPYWAHKRNIRAADGLLVPFAGTADVDAISAATPKSSYLLKTRTKIQHKRFRVMVEVNRSFDFNDYWHPQRFPDDPVYSGSGASGQPSLIYGATIDMESSEHPPYPMRLLGHGHHSGQDGTLYTDLQGIDSARRIFDMLIVKTAAPSPQ